MACVQKTILLLLSIVIVDIYAKTQIVDLSHVYDKDAIGWPIFPAVNITIGYRGYSPLYKAWLEHNFINANEHMGTHVDAPSHFGVRGAWRTHQIPMVRMFGRGVVINVKAKAAKDPNYAVSIDDVKDWEKRHGVIPPGAVVMMNSGWYRKYPERHRVFNTTDLKNESSYSFPGFPGETTEWLIKERKISILGVDTPSLDDGYSIRRKEFKSHVTASRNNVIGIENLANLDAMPESGTMVYVPVPKTRDGSGGLARVFATYDDAMNTACGSMYDRVLVGFCLCIAGLLDIG